MEETADGERSDTDVEESMDLEGPVGDDLSSVGYRRTQSTCHEEECDGTLWYDDHTLVCGQCSTAIDLDQRRRRVVVEDPWERYRRDPPRYHNSGIVRMPGGFLSAYNWVESDDIDGGVGSVNPEEFYL